MEGDGPSAPSKLTNVVVRIGRAGKIMDFEGPKPSNRGFSLASSASFVRLQLALTAKD
jgi:hypothetical protein